jgi:hypothetical protein
MYKKLPDLDFHKAIYKVYTKDLKLENSHRHKNEIGPAGFPPEGRMGGGVRLPQMTQGGYPPQLDFFFFKFLILKI